MSQSKSNDEPKSKSVMYLFDELLRELRYAKPDDRSETDRRYAVTITEVEKASAYFTLNIYNKEISDSGD